MSVQNQEEETRLFQKAYSDYRQVFVASPSFGILAPYDHIQTAKNNPLRLAAYDSMLKDHVRELANELNEFRYLIAQLFAWSKVLPNYDVKDQMALMMEFVKNITITCVNYPYAIKQRLIFSVAHLSHQANLHTDKSWKESNLPEDREIKERMLHKFGKNWDNFKYFESELNLLFDKTYQVATSEFRHKYQHRFPPGIEHGHTQFFSRQITTDGQISYGFGCLEPLSLTKIVPILGQQHSRAITCFHHYSYLIKEQLTAVHSTQSKVFDFKEGKFLEGI